MPVYDCGDPDCTQCRMAFRQPATPNAAADRAGLKEWREEITHPNNRLLFKRMCEKAQIDLTVDDIASGLAKVAALAPPTGTSAPADVQTRTGGGDDGAARALCEAQFGPWDNVGQLDRERSRLLVGIVLDVARTGGGDAEERE